MPVGATRWRHNLCVSAASRLFKIMLSIHPFIPIIFENSKILLCVEVLLRDDADVRSLWSALSASKILHRGSIWD